MPNKFEYVAHKLVLLALICPLAAHAAPGDTYYVDKNHSNASDANSGTESLPWKTIQHAANTLTAGETVLVKEGIYTELFGGSPEITLQAVKPQNSGTASNPITYEAHPDHRVVLDQQNSGPGFYVEDMDYITISGFEIRNTFIGGGVYTADGSIETIVENCHIHHIDGSPGSNVGGIRFDNCINCVARDNVIHDVNVAGTHTQFTNGANSAGIHSFGMENTVIENNEIYNTYNGVFHKRSSGNKGAIVRYNVIHDTTQGVFYSVQANGSPPHIDQEIYNNIFFNVVNGVTNDAHDAASVSSGLDIYNNVFDVSNGALEVHDVEDIQFFNNIVLLAAGKSIYIDEFHNTPSTLTYFDNNCYYQAQQFAVQLGGPAEAIYGNLGSWRSATGHDMASLLTDPLFVDRNARKYQLQSSSPCKGGGQSGEDIGAYITGLEIVGPHHQPNPPTDLLLQ